MAEDYDLIWASSETAAEYLSAKLSKPVEVIRIATNEQYFKGGEFNPKLKCDYCFTGSYFTAEREILYYLHPNTMPFEFAVYGHGWENMAAFARFHRGAIAYSRVRDIYASTRIVIDDANSATKKWASVNSRVYDALAAGALVITNGSVGAAEVFGDLLPVYSNSQELDALLWKYLTDEPARLALVKQLQDLISRSETYHHRANQAVRSIVSASERQIRFSIKIGAPHRGVKDEWGDYHFAVSLKHALTRLGHVVRIDFLSEWDSERCIGDDVVIVFRGLSVYRPKSHQINLMWNISHPDAISIEEYNLYDHVFIASKKHAAKLAGELKVSVSALLQCTDARIFNPAVGEVDNGSSILFVGNSRKVHRPMVRYAIEKNAPLEVHGTRWESLIDPTYIASQNISNAKLGGFYKSAKAVLNDHWADMRKRGFISNRIFDAAAASGLVITDSIDGLEEIFGDSVLVADSADELSEAITFIDENPAKILAMRKAASEIVLRHHTFEHRVEEILSVVGRIAESKGIEKWDYFSLPSEMDASGTIKN